MLKQFLARVEAYRATHGLSKAAFGRAAMGDQNFLYQLEKGRMPRLDTIAAVQRWMTANRERPGDASSGSCSPRRRRCSTAPPTSTGPGE